MLISYGVVKIIITMILLCICFVSTTMVLLDEYSAKITFFDEYFKRKQKNNLKILPETDHDDKDVCPPLFERKIYDISLVIPVRNRECNLKKDVDEIINILENVSIKNNISWEIVVVDNGSIDNTYLISQGYTKNYSNIRLIRNDIILPDGDIIQIGIFYSYGAEIFVVNTNANIISTYLESFIQNKLSVNNSDKESHVCIGLCVFNNNKNKNQDVFRKMNSIDQFSKPQSSLISISKRSARVILPNIHIKSIFMIYEIIYLSQKLFGECLVYKIEKHFEQKPGILEYLYDSWIRLYIRLNYYLSIWTFTKKYPNFNA